PTRKQVYSPPKGRIIFHCYHGHPVIIWSLGVLVYYLVCRFCPFSMDEDIITRHYLLPAMAFWFLFPECQHLVKLCLSICPLDRPSLEDLFHHSWL
ncbi:PIM3 kinase, partial [Erythrocercus mccallii]|nr:PIM3 kinase [Erythrocercus mccallii]